MQPEPFQINISDDLLEDLRNRLSATRWPDELPGVGWDYGSNLDYMKDLVDYWRNDFDWREQERLINSFSHFMGDGRRTGDTLHPRAWTRARPDAARHYARLARNILRNAQAHPSARRSGIPRW